MNTERSRVTPSSSGVDVSEVVLLQPSGAGGEGRRDQQPTTPMTTTTKYRVMRITKRMKEGKMGMATRCDAE